ncbi:glycosyltransferase involved in cell wall biosynthesis [Flavobacteriaceae bacterium MAR_2010_105]|nr:glycosyltransferase involved in cell wall biosynthesis [Flavobacteriaceae bacterium MAR_2010_105]
MNPLVSIIIPNYNRATLIGETLDSILAQTYTYWECLVIDDGSSDGSEAVIQAYCDQDARIQFYKRPADRPKGSNACRNYGLELSQGDYINWFDSDDLMHPDKLKLQVKAFEKSDLNYCICQSLVFQDRIDNILGLKSDQIVSDNVFEDFIYKKLIIPIQAPIFRKCFIMANDLRFDESLNAGQEWEFFSRILYLNENFIPLNIPLDFIRQHMNSISGNIGEVEIWNYFFARYKIYSSLKKDLSKNLVNYFNRYFVDHYKIFLRNRQFKEAFFVWKYCLIRNQKFSMLQHLLILVGFGSYLLFGKGESFLIAIK